MEPTKIELPSGAVAYIKAELTAGDADDIQDVYFEGVKVRMKRNDVTGKMEQEPIEVSPSVITKQKYKLLSIGVVKVEKDGETVSPVPMEYFRGMGVADVEILETECNNIGGKLKSPEEIAK